MTDSRDCRPICRFAGSGDTTHNSGAPSIIYCFRGHHGSGSGDTTQVRGTPHIIERDRGEPRGSAPPTPPGIRVRTRRFDRVKRLTRPPPEEGQSSRNRRWTGRAAPSHGEPCAGTQTPSRRQPPLTTPVRSFLTETGFSVRCGCRGFVAWSGYEGPAHINRTKASKDRSRSGPAFFATFAIFGCDQRVIAWAPSFQNHPPSTPKPSLSWRPRRSGAWTVGSGPWKSRQRCRRS
jgi:hypothetical protein